MPREISYANVENPEEKAINDIREYLGDQRFNDLEELIPLAFKEGKIDRKSLVMQLRLLAGINGYPVTVWLDKLGVTE